MMNDRVNVYGTDELHITVRGIVHIHGTQALDYCSSIGIGHIKSHDVNIPHLRDA